MRRLQLGRLRWTTLAVAVVAATAVGAIPATHADASGPAPLQTEKQKQQSVDDGSAKPTIVLVHGAFADASGWSAEIQTLQDRGFDVIAPANPLRGLTADAGYIRSVLDSIAGPVILVGHSYGGAVITNAARDDANVKALVYVGAFVPDEGESIATSYDPAAYPGSLLGPDTTLVRPVDNPAAGGPDVDVYIKPSEFRNVFAGDEDAQTAAVMAASQRPLSFFAETEPSGAPAWKSIPSWDLVTLDDHAISPGGQVYMAQRAGAHITEVHSAHDVMVSHPKDVVKIIMQAVKSVS